MELNEEKCHGDWRYKGRSGCLNSVRESRVRCTCQHVRYKYRYVKWKKKWSVIHVELQLSNNHCFKNTGRLFWPSSTGTAVLESVRFVKISNEVPLEILIWGPSAQPWGKPAKYKLSDISPSLINKKRTCAQGACGI